MHPPRPLQGHNPICAGGPNVPASVTSDITVEGVAAELAAAGIQVLAIDVGALDSTFTNVWGSCAGPETQPPQATTLASATGGSYTSGEGWACRELLLHGGGAWHAGRKRLQLCVPLVIGQCSIRSIQTRLRIAGFDNPFHVFATCRRELLHHCGHNHRGRQGGILPLLLRPHLLRH